MPTTSSSLLRYPASSDTPNIPQDIQNLATDLDKKVTPNVASIAARNTLVPSPVQGQSVSVAGVLHRYDGTGWRFLRYGNVNSTTTDANGSVAFSHGGGSTPITWGGILTAQFSDQLNTILSFLAVAQSSTTLTARFARQDTYAYLVTTNVSFAWWAWF